MRNIYFSFDIENDTALGVAAEMVAELSITDHDVTEIAEMINGEVSSLVPQWKKTGGVDISEIPEDVISSFSSNHESDVSSGCSMLNYLSINNGSCGDLNATSCTHIDCAIHGRFEEVTYHVIESKGDEMEAPSIFSSQSDPPHSCNLDEGLIKHRQSSKHEGPNSENCPLKMPEDLGEMHKRAECLEKRHAEIGDIKSSCSEPSDLRESEEQNKIVNSSTHRPLQDSDDKPIKSFHLGRNFSYHIPSNDSFSTDGDRDNFHVKKSANNGNGFQWTGHPCQVKPNNATESIFEKGVYIAHAMSSVPSHSKWML